MSQSIKFDNNTYMDASGIYDPSKSAKQSELNVHIPTVSTTTFTLAKTQPDGWISQLATYLTNLSQYTNADWDSMAAEEGRFVGYKNSTTAGGLRFTKNKIAIIEYNITTDVMVHKWISIV